MEIYLIKNMGRRFGLRMLRKHKFFIADSYLDPESAYKNVHKTVHSNVGIFRLMSYLNILTVLMLLCLKSADITWTNH